MDDVVTEMVFPQSLNGRAKGDRTYHLLFSFQEQIDSMKIAEIEDEVCRKPGLGNLQRISVIHGDRVPAPPDNYTKLPAHLKRTCRKLPNCN